MDRWTWIVVGGMLAAGCAGGELYGLDAGRQNPGGTPRGGTGVALDGGDVRASETDAGMDPDAEMDGHADVTPPEPESRAHCILSDASVSHLGVQSVAIAPDGTPRRRRRRCRPAVQRG